MAANVWIEKDMERKQLPKAATPHQRLIRMRNTFEYNRSILVEDYQYFTAPDGRATPHAPTRPNKAARMSVERSERQSQEQSETPSSDKSDD